MCPEALHERTVFLRKWAVQLQRWLQCRRKLAAEDRLRRAPALVLVSSVIHRVKLPWGMSSKYALIVVAESAEALYESVPLVHEQLVLDPVAKIASRVVESRGGLLLPLRLLVDLNALAGH